jgi:hypothetical protein
MFTGDLMLAMGGASIAEGYYIIYFQNSGSFVRSVREMCVLENYM